jgi:hypothetical protein
LCCRPLAGAIRGNAAAARLFPRMPPVARC